MLGLWLIMIPIFGAVAAYLFGRYDWDRPAPMVFAILLWPLVVAVVIVFGPFVGLYALGQRKYNTDVEKHNEATRKTK